MILSGMPKAMQGIASIAGAPQDMSKRVAPWLPGSASSLDANMATANTIGQIGGIARNPYGNIPKGILYNAQDDVEDQYQGARQRVQAGVSGSGLAGSGVARGILGNLEMGRGAGMADARASWDELQTRIGDQRIASLLLPFLNEQYDQHQMGANALIGQPKQQQGPGAGDTMSKMFGAFMQMYGGRGGGGSTSGTGSAPPDYSYDIGAPPR